MTSRLFLYHNYDTMLMSIQALDPHAFDNLTSESCNLNILELFVIRTNSLMKYNNSCYINTLYYAIIIAQDISLVLSAIKIQQNVNEILRDIAKQKNHAELYSLTTHNYIKRFILNYRKSFKPYLVGYGKYSTDEWITKIGFINLFIIYKLYDQNGLYFMFFYLLYNKRKT
uniref:Uncharacterized protein n=1 Tax=Liagoropsis maxima TaxID=1653392 RepID=A0A1G4NWI8_9FLOR|nr:Hypothetical protein ORF_6 [Liagoropsis maxima]SCW22876.1 Hypothetical protein ORF_6 [Liagoropsis maxima]